MKIQRIGFAGGLIIKTKHFDYLDSVRGMACIIVVITHMGINTKTGFFSIIGGHFFIAGSASVCLFFILSGFVLSYKYIGDYRSKIKVWESIIKRPLRLIGVVLFASYLGLLQYPDMINANLMKLFIWNSITHPFTFASIDAFQWSNTLWNNALWTINIELMGSFLTFSLILFTCNINKAIRMILMICVALLLCKTFYLFFMFGIIVSDIFKNWSINNKNLEYKKHASWMLIVPSIILFSYPSGINPNNWNSLNSVDLGYVMIAIGSMLVFVVVCINDKIQNLLRYNRLIFLGKISYSLYAIHFPIITITSGLLINRFLSNYFETTILFRCIITIPIIILCAWMVDKYIDKPCIKFSGWFAKNLIKEIQQKIAKVQFKRKPDAVIPEIVTAATDLVEDVQAAELANYPVQEAD